MKKGEIVRKILTEAKKKSKSKENKLTPTQKQLYSIDKETLLDYIQTSQEESQWDEDLAKSILRAYNIIVNNHTLGFFEELYDVNSKIDYKPVDRVERIIIPKLKKFEIDYSVVMTKSGREYWEDTVYAWSEQELNNKIDNGDLNWWNGDFVEFDVFDSYTDDVDTDIREIQ